MKKNIFISLTSIHTQDGEKDQSELVTRATYHSENGADVITYEDTEATGYQGSVTTITVSGSERASIVRKGATNSVLTMEMGKKHYCHYGTPYGDMQIGVYTHNIDNSLTSDGKLYMKYTLDLNSSFLSDNEIILSIKN